MPMRLASGSQFSKKILLAISTSSRNSGFLLKSALNVSSIFFFLNRSSTSLFSWWTGVSSAGVRRSSLKIRGSSCGAVARIRTKRVPCGTGRVAEPSNNSLELPQVLPSFESSRIPDSRMPAVMPFFPVFTVTSPVAGHGNSAVR